MSIDGKMKRAAQEIFAGQNIKIVIGEVTSVSPLEVMLEQRLPLPEKALIFPERLQEQVLEVKDYKTDPCSGGDIGSGGTLTEVTRKYTIQRKLKMGDKLILSVVGEEYLIIDREGDPNATITFTSE